MSRVLERAGFVLARQRGSHGLYVKGNIVLTVAAHNEPDPAPRAQGIWAGKFHKESAPPTIS